MAHEYVSVLLLLTAFAAGFMLAWIAAVRRGQAHTRTVCENLLKHFEAMRRVEVLHRWYKEGRDITHVARMLQQTPLDKQYLCFPEPPKRQPGEPVTLPPSLFEFLSEVPQ